MDGQRYSTKSDSIETKSVGVKLAFSRIDHIISRTDYITTITSAGKANSNSS